MNRLQSNVVKAFTGYYRLKDFIHELRACKTQAAERALVAKESFAIRTAFKEESSQEQRYHSVSKLLYIHLLGYPSHFGQVECLKLAASPRLTDKRLGYLGVLLLLDEEQQTLTLVTNSLKSDLNSTNPLVVGLALSALAAVASEEMAWELADEVERLLASPNAMLRRKAGLCAARLASKVPDLLDQFGARVASLVQDRTSHGTVLSGLALAQVMVRLGGPSAVNELRSLLLPSLVRLLQSLLGAAYVADHDVGGINDPFLQVAVLRLLRALGHGDGPASDAMADVLTQLTTATDATRQAGQAVLYEALLTILSIRADAQLRAMAVGQLARLLAASSDVNLRYVALHLLGRVVDDEGAGGLELVSRHRDTILGCLDEADISIRRRAADLACALITRRTAKDVLARLLPLATAPRSTPVDAELAASLAQRIAILAARHAPSAHWYADTLLQLLAALPNNVAAKEEIVSSFLRIVNNTPALHLYATRTLFEAMPQSGRATEALVQATVWCLGEYGDTLVGATLVTPEQIIEALRSWARLPSLSALPVQSYIITALGKLALRFEPAGCLGAVQSALMELAKSPADDVAQKASETLALAGNTALRARVFAPIIPDDPSCQLGNDNHASAFTPMMDGGRADSPAPTVDVFAELALLSLDGVGSASGNSSASVATPRGTAFSSSLPSPLQLGPSDGRQCYNSHGLQIALALQPDVQEAGSRHILLTARNKSPSSISGLQVLCAVPKSLRVILDPASGSTLPPQGTITQRIRVSPAEATGEAVDPTKIKLRVRITFQPAQSPQPITETVEVSSLE